MNLNFCPYLEVTCGVSSLSRVWGLSDPSRVVLQLGVVVQRSNLHHAAGSCATRAAKTPLSVPQSYPISLADVSGRVTWMAIVLVDSETHNLRYLSLEVGTLTIVPPSKTSCWI